MSARESSKGTFRLGIAGHVDESVVVAEDISSALEREGVWDTFLTLPDSLREEFVQWVDSATGERHRRRRIQTLASLLRQNPSAD